jgi:D-alanine-D-alanine ligase
MRVCVLTDEEPRDFDPGPFLAGYQWEMVTMTAPVFERIESVAGRDEFDVFLNICDGWVPDPANALAYEGIEVIRALEGLNLPYTGADERFFDPSREAMQAVAEARGIGFARGFQAMTVEDAQRLVEHLRFPVMVKHPRGYGSTGVYRDSRVDTLDQLRVRVERTCAEFGAARVEEFIVGREFSVLVVETPDDLPSPFAYPPTELIFPPGEEFWHVDIKWNDDVPFAFRRVADPELAARLQETAKALFVAMHGVGYGRCDIRMNDQGELFVLEINANPAIMYKPEERGPADHMILYDPDGYRGFFDRIFRAAVVRWEARAAKEGGATQGPALV